jgi:two-component system, cell cycle sensor histidine kinase and response regulator CckA
LSTGSSGTLQPSATPSGRKLRLLLLEDQEDDALLLLHELERIGYEVTWERVQSGEAMLSALAKRQWDTIISDFSMPQFSARDALTLCREQGIELPFIIVSGTIDEETAVESLHLGAEDFITKGRLARLGPAIERGLRVYQERQARRTAETRLRQAQKMEAVGQLAGGVAHDFNNLLGVIQGYGELLLKTFAPDDPRRGRLEQILQASTRGASLTRQLLTFSRQQPLEARRLDLNSVVSAMEPLLRRLIGENIEIVAVSDERLHHVLADPIQLEQVLMNLAINARDAMSGFGRLTIETTNVEADETFVLSYPDMKPGQYAMLAVSDTGHGMDAQTLAHVFEPFFTTKERGKGTGLGLATVYGVVRQSGGHVVLYSEPGRGTTVKVYLPRTEQVGAMPAAPSAEAAGTGWETVVLVEDDASLRAAIRDLLHEGGYNVIDSPSPEATLAAAEAYAGPIHLLLTDLVMPRMSGRDAAAQIEAIRPGVKVLYMSGYADAAAAHNGDLPQPHAFLQKPFSLDVLLRKVREVLDAPR